MKLHTGEISKSKSLTGFGSFAEAKIKLKIYLEALYLKKNERIWHLEEN
jgi:hypothetical protein